MGDSHADSEAVDVCPFIKRLTSQHLRRHPALQHLQLERAGVKQLHIAHHLTLLAKDVDT